MATNIFVCLLHSKRLTVPSSWYNRSSVKKGEGVIQMDGVLSNIFYFFNKSYVITCSVVLWLTLKRIERSRTDPDMTLSVGKNTMQRGGVCR